nr:alpha/beta hydrolase fold domain-containing protein [Streptomyces sp. CB01883]
MPAPPGDRRRLRHPSHPRFAEGYWLTRDGMKWFRDACAGDDAQRAEVHAAPLKAPLELLRRLPTTLVITD